MGTSGPPFPLPLPPPPPLHHECRLVPPLVFLHRSVGGSYATSCTSTALEGPHLCGRQTKEGTQSAVSVYDELEIGAGAATIEVESARLKNHIGVGKTSSGTGLGDLTALTTTTYSSPSLACHNTASSSSAQRGAEVCLISPFLLPFSPFQRCTRPRVDIATVYL